MKINITSLSRPWRVLIGAGILLLTFTIGVKWGEVSDENRALSLENAQSTLISLRQENADLLRQTHQLETRFALLEMEHSALQDSYGQSLNDVADLQETVAFYQNVVAPEKVNDGLVVDGLALEALKQPGKFRLQFVLMQNFARRAVVKGDMQICIEGQQGGASKILCPGTSHILPDGPLKYRFKFFQAVTLAVSLPEGFTPQALTFTTDVYRYTTKRQDFSWVVDWTEALSGAAISNG